MSGLLAATLRPATAQLPTWIMARFSSGDRAVMSEWVKRWGRPGAFCVLHSPRGAHCEVYPWAGPRREVRPPD